MLPRGIKGGEKRDMETRWMGKEVRLPQKEDEAGRPESQLAFG
jgi:hypothetical protein